MKVVVRSSSLLFFLVSILLGLPIHRRNRRIGIEQTAVADRGVRLSQLRNSAPAR